MANPTKQRRPAKPPQRSERLTIAVVSLLVVSIVGFVVWTKLQKPFILKAKFNYADGLKPGAEVEFSGVKVGKVEDIQFLDVPPDSSHNEIFEVIFSISQDIDNHPAGEMIRKDAEAVLIVSGALGDRSIDILPGNPSAPPTKSGDYIRSRVEPTISMLADRWGTVQDNFGRVREIVQEASYKIDHDQGLIGKLSTGEFSRNINQLLEQFQELQKAFEKGNGSLSQFSRNKKLGENFNRLVDQGEQLRRNFEQGQGAAGKFAHDSELQQKLQLVQAHATELSNTIDRVYGRARNGSGSLANFSQGEEFKRSLAELSQSIENISQMTAKKQGTVGLLMHDGRLSENVGDLSAELIKLLYDFQQKPTKYVKFTLF